MANQSAKRQAQLNRAQLAIHRRVFVFTYVICFAFFLFARRPIISQIVLSAPGFYCGYYVQKLCTPKFDASGQLISPGQDFDAKGVMEYMKDVVYLTCICLLLSAGFGMKAWLLLLAVPIFAVYKAISLFRTGMGMFQQPQQSNSRK